MLVRKSPHIYIYIHMYYSPLQCWRLKVIGFNSSVRLDLIVFWFPASANPPQSHHNTPGIPLNFLKLCLDSCIHLLDTTIFIVSCMTSPIFIVWTVAWSSYRGCFAPYGSITLIIPSSLGVSVQRALFISTCISNKTNKALHCTAFVPSAKNGLAATMCFLHVLGSLVLGCLF